MEFHITYKPAYPPPKWVPLPPRPTVCMFCGGGPMSGEHLIAKWMHPYLPLPVTPPEERSESRHRVSTTMVHPDGKRGRIEAVGSRRM
jgi:hypothetical protein